jgi:hypothetical protein
MSGRLAAIAFLVFAPFAHAQSRGKVDWIFAVDTSASMRGVGGTKDIFGDVKQSLDTFVREASDGDSVSVLTFDRDVHSHGLRDLHGQFDRDELHSTISDLQANGNRTYLGLAIAKALERADSLRQRGDPTRSRAVVLFTDGKEDVRGIPNPVTIPSNVRLTGDTFVFFVSMGEHEPQLDAFERATRRTRVLKAPTPDAIRHVAEEIRTTIVPPAPPPKPIAFTITPTVLDFGSMELGSTAEREVTIAADAPARVALRADVPTGMTIAPLETIAVAPGKPAHIMLRVTLAKDALTGTKQIALHAGNASASATVQAIEPPLLVRIAKWLVALALIAAAIAAWWLRRKAQNRLEGELEIVQPRVAPDAAFVGLPALRTDEIALSAIVPSDVLNGSDARLYVKRSGREKKVCIASEGGGALRVNDIETPVSELYDADLIEIGSAKLRFNRAGCVRASATGEEL